MAAGIAPAGDDGDGDDGRLLRRRTRGAGAAAPSGALELTAPISVTIPLRDPSIVTGWDASAPPARQAARVNIDRGAIATPVYNNTCPVSPEGAARGIVARVAVSGDSEEGAPLPASAPAPTGAVRLVSATQVGYTGVVGQQQPERRWRRRGGAAYCRRHARQLHAAPGRLWRGRAHHCRLRIIVPAQIGLRRGL